MNNATGLDLISVIVPIYKVEEYLDQCVESICVQTYKNIEIILVDDGSPDKCPELCEQYALKDERIIVVHKENGGLSDARNYGIDVSKGKYLIFVDSDDYIEKDMIQRLYDALQKSKADMVVGGINYVDENGRILLKTQENLPEGTISQQDFWEKYYGSYTIPCVVVWNKIYKKSFFKDIKFSKGKYHEDEFILHKIVTKCDKIACISDAVYNYRQRQNSIMSQEYSVKHLDVIEALMERSMYFFNNNNMFLAEKALTSAIGKFIKAYMRLDLRNEKNQNRYRSLKKQFTKIYWKYVFHIASLRFVFNVLTFVINERCYIITHKEKLKKYI